MKYLIWDESIMLESYEFLKKLIALGFDFVLIGGWAVYFLTKYHMSRDVDLFIRDRNFWKLKNYILSIGGKEKVGGLKKRGFTIKEVELDIYTESDSDLPISAKEVFEQQCFKEIDNVKVLQPEPLLILKLKAVRARHQTVKGLKDRCDILSLCLLSNMDFTKLRSLLEQKKFVGFSKILEEIIINSGKEYAYVFKKELIPSKLKKVKTQLICQIRNQ